MWQSLGEFVSRRWYVILGCWLLLVIGSTGVLRGWINRLNILPQRLPMWEDVIEDGEFAFLPPGMPSLRGEELFKQAFPGDLLTSSVVIVVRHESAHLDDRDREFITDILVPRLQAIQKEPGSIIGKVRAFDDPQIGQLLVSEDKKASLVIVELTTEFLEHKNRPTIEMIERLIDPDQGELRPQVPPGVHLALSGSATVGRDMIAAQQESAKNTERYTILLVVGLLLLIYRAPLLALIPLLSVFVAVEISLTIIVLLAGLPNSIFEPFEGLKTYTTVVTYGAGVDYCLFLIARYKEETERVGSLEEALVTTISKVGAALTASAATVACGIGMMVFAQFGKFRQAGMGMSLSLIIMLIASVTFTPALLRLFGNWAFWPYGLCERPAGDPGWISGTNIVARWFDRNNISQVWHVVGDAVVRIPGRIWLTCVAVMLPFALIGIIFHGHMSYGLLSELPQNKQSVVGAKAVQDHFPAGNTGPITVLIENPKVDLLSPQGLKALAALTDELKLRDQALGIADIRSVSSPMGLAHRPTFVQRGVARRYYISQVEKHKGHVARIDVISDRDPFSRDSVDQLNQVQTTIAQRLASSGASQPAPARPHEAVAAEDSAEGENEDGEADDANALAFLAGSTAHYVGTTASMRDVRSVTDRDQIVIDGLVLLVVYLILCVLLRKPAISAYLIISVFFSYFVSLGCTFVVFYLVTPDFAGLDWKVPMFLFTILIAVGEDYNIFLMTRIDEEQHLHGPVEGVRVSLLQTGSIISSCGIIMAGTFFSLVLAGSLVGMQQLGFALALGVLLDTYVVRPLLVPAYLVMLHSGRFGRLGKYMGSLAHLTKPPAGNSEQA